MENKGKTKEGKKILLFVLICAGAGVLGFFSSMGIAYLKDSGFDFAGVFDTIMRVVAPAVPLFFVGSNLVASVVSFSSYARYKKMAKAWDGEEEDVIDAVELGLNTPVSIANAMTLLNLFFFSATVWVSENTAFGEKWALLLLVGSIAVLLFGLVWTVVISRNIVNLEKSLNPEKQGSVFDLDFQKKWHDSCDEAQQLIIHRAAYKAFGVGNTLCAILWLVTFFTMLFADTGLMPVVCVCLVWFVQITVYTAEAKKLEAGKKK